MLSDSSSSDSSSPIRKNGKGKQKLLESSSLDSEIDSPIIKKRKAPHRRRDLSTSESSESDVVGRSRKKIKVASSTSDSSFDGDEVIAKGMISRKNMRVPSDSDSSSDSEIEEICRIRTRAGRSASARAISSNSGSSTSTDEPSNSLSKKSQKTLGDSSSDGDDADRCIICFKTYNGEVAQPSGCAHTFHAECLLTWSKTSNTCPIDRVKYETVLVKKASGEVSQRYNVVTPPPQDHNNDIIEPDDTTFCEVCNQQDREEEMLLCDRCEAGYHLNCLTPPLQAIPVGDWYCPDCALIENAVIEEDEIRDLLRGAAILQNRLRRLSESRPPRHGFRTRATNRVIEALQQMAEQPSTSSGRMRIGSGRVQAPRRAPPRARNTRSRYRVELVTVEDGSTVEVKVAVNTRRRRKKRKSKKSSRKNKTKTNRSSRMAVMAGETSRSSASGIGPQSLDILGSRPQLEYFSGCEGEDEMDEDLSGGGLGVMRYRRGAATARSMTGRKQIAAQIFNANPRRPAAAARPPASAPPDLLSSILQQQIMWHSPNAVFHSNSNGEVQVVLQGGDPENLPVKKTVGSGESRGGGQRRNGGGGRSGGGEDERSHHRGGGEPIGPIPPLQPPPQPPVFSRVYDEEDFDLYADIEPPPLMEPPLVPPPEPPALLLAPLEGEEGSSSPEDTMLVIDDRQVYDPDMPTSPPSDVDPSEENEPPLPPILQIENKPNDYTQAVDLTSIRLPSPEPEMDDCPNRSLYSQASVNIARQTKTDSDSDSEPQSELAPIPIPPPLLSSCLNTKVSLDDEGESTKIDLFEDAPSPDVSARGDSGEVAELSKKLEKEGTVVLDQLANDEKVDIKGSTSSNENTEDEEIEVDDNISDHPKDVKVKCDIGEEKEAMSEDEASNLCIGDDEESETVKEKTSSDIIADSNGVCDKEADYELMDTSDPLLEKAKSIKEITVDEGSCSSQQEVDEQLQKHMEDIKLGSGDDEKKQVETKYEEEDDEEDNLKLNYSDVSSSIKKSDSSLDIPKSDQHSDVEEQADKCKPSTSRNDTMAEEHIEKKVLRKSRSSSKKRKKIRDSSGEGSPRRNNVDSEKSDREGEDVLELGCGDDERDGLVDITDEEMSNYEKCWEIEEHQGDKAGIEGLETEAISDCEYNIAEEVLQSLPKFTAENGPSSFGPKEEGEIVSEERRPVSPIQWKKISKSTKERSYRDKDSYKEKSKKKEKKPKEKRKELERYDVRKIISDKPKKRKVDEFGRDISSSKSRSRSGSRSRSLSRRKSRSRSRKRRSQEKRSTNKSRGKSRDREREKKSKERTVVKNRDRSKRSRGRSSKSRSRSGSRRKRSRSPRRNDRKERRSRPKSKERGEKKKRARRESSFSCSSCSCSSCERERRKTNKKLTVIVPNKSAVSSVVKDKRKGKYREKEVSKRRRADSPVPSKEVFTSGDNILVSVNFKSSKTGERSREKEKSKKKKDDEPKKKKDKNSKENQPIRSIVSKGGLSEQASVRRKKIDLKNVKPVAIIDLAQSPFREQTLSPTEVIVLTDSDSDDKRKNDETNHQPMVTGPKTPPEPQIRFNIVSSKPQIRNLTNPLMDSVEQGERDGEEDDERIEILHKGPNTPPEPPVPYDPFEPTKSRSPSPLIDIESARNPSPSVVEIISRPTEVPQHVVGHRDVSPKLIMQHDSPKTPSPLHTPPKPVRESTPEKAALSPANNHNDDSLDMGGGGGDSPYSPGSSDGDDMFEPPMMPQISTPTPIAKVKPRPIQQPPKHSALKLTPSPLKRKPAKTSTPLKNSKGNSRKEIGLKLDEDQLKILDDLPNSAVEMQVKDKFLKKLNRQERVVEEVKMVLKPHYAKKHVTKEEYKEILRKSVPKICHSRSQEINPMKIQRLIEAYVKKYRHHKKKRKPFLGGLPESLQQVLKPKPKTTMWC